MKGAPGNAGRAGLLLWLAVHLAGPPVWADDGQRAAIDQVKAAFLLKFGYFVTWPEAHFSVEETPLVIGILGQTSFGGYLEPIVKDKKLQGRPIQVKHFARVDQLVPCSILFISPDLKSGTDQALAWAAGAHALTVGDGESFARRGGTVGFFLKDNKVRFAINRKAAARSGLTISARLLRLALLVEEEG